MALAFPSSDFWDFSLALYGKPGVAPACLALQERHGLDVNILMFCLWLAATGRGPVPAAALETAFVGAAPWHDDVVRHLRALRRRLKTPVGPADPALAQALRARIQKIEIDAEHIEQLTLATSAAASLPARTGRDSAALAADGAGHIAIYMRRIGGAADAASVAELAAIIADALGIAEAAARGHVEKAFATAGQ